MKYKWDHKLFQRLAKNPLVKKEMDEILSSKPSFFNEIYLPTKEDLAMDAYFLLDNKFLENMIFDYVSQMNCSYYPQRHYHTNIAKEEIFELTSSFYGTLDNSLLEPFNKLFAQRFDHFDFTTSPRSMLFSGYTYHLPTCNETFITVDYQKNLSCVLATIHEYAHAIWYILRNNNLENRNIFCEIESIFMELIAIDYFEKNYPRLQSDTKSLRVDFYNSLINDLATLQYKIMFTNDIFQSNIDLISDSLLKIILVLKKNNNLSLREVLAVLQMPADILSMYPVGSLIATELYNIYEQSPDEAMRLYKNLVYLQNQSSDNAKIYEQIKKMGITPAKNVKILARKINKD